MDLREERGEKKKEENRSERAAGRETGGRRDGRSRLSDSGGEEGEGFAPDSPAVVSLLAEFIVSPAVLVFFIALSLDASSLSVGAGRFGFVILIR